MRYRLLGIVLLYSISLTAQDDKMPYYIQQAPVQEIQLDCFDRSLEEGKAAQKRGDCRTALRLFRDAERCPDVLRMPGRLEELKTLIAACESIQAKATIAPKPVEKVRETAAQVAIPTVATPETHRKFRPSRQFLRYDKPECFDITCKEAARAFAGGYWDDATALYRAAKNCADADQADRQFANQRIQACRAAAEEELRKKEQEAIRQARHALAANRANEARQLLRDFDRSLAYRLADFANEYIAPEDNDACRQVMFDALYYAPSIHAGTSNRQMQIPFCYQLGDNLDQDLQLTFLEGRQPVICAFARSRHLLFQWDAQTFEPFIPVRLEDTTMQYMDAVPDGRTLLFFSKDAYLFRRNAWEILRVPAQVSLYCFSPSGDTFYYLDPEEMAIYSLDLRDAFKTRKGFSERARPQPLGIKIPYGILSLASGTDELWLGYREGVLVFGPADPGKKTWNQKRQYQFGYRIGNYSQGHTPYLWMDPAVETAVFTNDTAVVLFQLAQPDTGLIMPAQRFAGNALAIGSNSEYIATYQASLYGSESRMFIMRAEDGILKYGALVPTVSPAMHLRAGAFSPDNRMFISTTGSGKLTVWMLGDGPNQKVNSYGGCKYIEPNADGTRLFLWRQDSLLEVSPDRPGDILHYTEAPEFADLPHILAGQDWLSYRTGPDAVILTRQLGREEITVPSPPGEFYEISGAFSSGDREFVCLAAQDSVIVYRLPDGQPVASKGFGGTILQVHFVPQTDEVLVISLVESASMGIGQTVIKLWDPAKPAASNVRTVRLQGYDTRETRFCESQGLIAFTDGLDIRVFRQTDLLNELIRIRQNGTHMVMAMDFHPDGNILAAGYEDGSVVFWDIRNGQARFSWAKPPGDDEQDFTGIVRLKFVEGGRRLEILYLGSQLLTRDLEVSLIRAGVQTDFRKLIAFQPSQIREYNLEEALDYPNNFTRLAASGDLPLIRSFFDYFRETALYSNNISRVGNSCSRAGILYGQLDSSTQNVLRPILLEMFDDYHWKLLLRNQTNAARQVAEAMKRDFGNSPAAIRAAAHTALLQNYQREAARQYAEWAIRVADTGSGDGIINPRILDSLQAQVRQLMEYDLIRPEQLDCLCGLFGDFSAYQQLCENRTAGTTDNLLGNEMQVRWRIFRRLNISQSSRYKREKVRLLEVALADTRQLQRLNPAIYSQEQEKVLLALSEAYSEAADFEQSGPQAIRYYSKAAGYLSDFESFRSRPREVSRLLNLAHTYLRIGEANYNMNRFAAAQEAYREGLHEANKLQTFVQNDQTLQQQYRDELNGLLAVRIGVTYLMQGNAPAALQSFEQAQNDRTEGIHRLYFGHVALLEDNEIRALLEYGNIYTDDKLGQALFDIDQMAKHLPDQRRRLLAFAGRLRDARLQTRVQIDSTAVDFYRMYPQIYATSCLDQWDSALQASVTASGLAKKMLEQPGAASIWHNNWLDAMLNQSYYLLFSRTCDTARLQRVIRLNDEVQLYFDTSSTFKYYQYRTLFKTNLAHAYLLRQLPGDRDQAIQIYKEFLQSTYGSLDTWELLFKDFRDLHRAGVPLPDLRSLILKIKPAAIEMEAADWESVGVRDEGG
ncbi:MAG: WD40 repeat domain-containing protein [Bacteroidetes bacterium]|nr:MAG: WD40 repeat domain-containing protein [Bacteroidota bacterium]